MSSAPEPLLYSLASIDLRGPFGNTTCMPEQLLFAHILMYWIVIGPDGW